MLEFHPQARRSAALAVLRSPDVPSVLFEAGFISNPDEAGRLASPAAQARFPEALARAIRVYFARPARGSLPARPARPVVATLWRPTETPCRRAATMAGT